MAQEQTQYPIQLSVDYPDRNLNRLTTFFRIIMILPIFVVLLALTWAAEIVILAPLLMIVFRRKYPRWWFDWNVALVKFQLRVVAFLFLLRDEYPSTDEEQAVHLEMPYPNVEQDLNRWLPLVKWVLAVPHYIAIAILSIISVVLMLISWFAILFTGRYPRGMFSFVVGTMRWSTRVEAYALVLVTDKYPPFRLRS